jgi:hypothetical protein
VASREPSLKLLTKLATMLTLFALSLLLTLATGARAEALSSAYDKPYVKKGDRACIPPAGAKWVFRDVEGSVLETSTEAQIAESSCAVVERIETIASNGQDLAYVFEPYPGGFVDVAELSTTVAMGAQAAVNPLDAGAAAPSLSPQPQYRVTPEDMWGPEGSPHTMCYLRQSVANTPGTSCGENYEYAPYGRPASGGKFALMTWSWVDVVGGGVARAAVAEGAYFYPADVMALEAPTVDATGKANGGEVWARYGYVLHTNAAKTERLYGWMVTKHTFGGICYDHMSYAGGGPERPNTLCPEGAPRRVVLRFDWPLSAQLVSW